MGSPFERYWSRKTATTPALNNDNVTMKITVASFRAELEKAFNAGADDGKEFCRRVDKLSGGGASLFEKIFGR